MSKSHKSIIIKKEIDMTHNLRKLMKSHLRLPRWEPLPINIRSFMILVLPNDLIQLIFAYLPDMLRAYPNPISLYWEYTRYPDNICEKYFNIFKCHKESLSEEILLISSHLQFKGYRPKCPIKAPYSSSQSMMIACEKKRTCNDAKLINEKKLHKVTSELEILLLRQKLLFKCINSQNNKQDDLDLQKLHECKESLKNTTDKIFLCRQQVNKLWDENVNLDCQASLINNEWWFADFDDVIRNTIITLEIDIAIAMNIEIKMESIKRSPIMLRQDSLTNVYKEWNCNAQKEYQKLIETQKRFGE